MTTRRGFIATSGALMLGAAGSPAVLSRKDHDLVIRGGMVYDGTGAEGTVLDVVSANGNGINISRGCSRVTFYGNEND